MDSEERSKDNQTDSPNPQNVREITLKTFAPSSEIEHPGFQLLSLTYPSASTHAPAFATTPCFLPDYPSTYTWRYLPLLVFTAFALVFLRRKKLRTHSLPTHLDSSALRNSFSLRSLPSAPWSPQPHPPTPFSSDWTPDTPGFYRSVKNPPSPHEEFPKGSIRGPLSSSSSQPTVSTLHVPSTPTFRATAIPRTDDDGYTNQLPTGPAHIDVDDLDDDEFAYGQYSQRQPLRVKVDRPGDLSPDSDSSASAVDELAFTFTLYGRRRRISFWIPLFTGRGQARSASLGLRRRSTRAFVKRIGMDLWYVMWPAVLLWLALAWLVS